MTAAYIWNLRHDRDKIASSKDETCLPIALALVGFTQVQAQSAKPVILVQSSPLNSSRQLNEPSIFNAPSPPPDVEQSSRRGEGGSRDGCKGIDNQLTPSKEKLLMALVPGYGPPDSESVWALTSVEHPTFWFYIPYSPPLSIEFVLQDEAKQTVYQTPVTLFGTPGVVSLSLPSTAAPLEIGKRYRWYFNIYCNPRQPPIL
jgi:hypothetical protein